MGSAGGKLAGDVVPAPGDVLARRDTDLRVQRHVIAYLRIYRFTGGLGPSSCDAAAICAANPIMNETQPDRKATTGPYASNK